MPTILPYGFIPVEIHYEKSNLPPLTIVEGDYQTRGYRVTFFNSAGDEIVHTDTQSARCYAVNPKVSDESYYTEGRYQDGYWYLWVPSKTLTVAGTVQIQIVLYEGNEQLIHTRVCKVRISPSIAQNAITNPDDGEAGPLPKSVLEAIQKMIKGSIDEEVGPIKEEQDKFATKEDLIVYATKEDLEKVGSAGYLYMLAEFDTTAGAEALQALQGHKRIEEVISDPTAMQAVVNSSAAMTAVANSSVSMQAVVNSSAAMTAVANSSAAMTAVANSSVSMQAVVDSNVAMDALLYSKNTKKLQTVTTISGRFLPLFASADGSDIQAYNGQWSNITTFVGSWLRTNVYNPIANHISVSDSKYFVVYYDLDA